MTSLDDFQSIDQITVLDGSTCVSLVPSKKFGASFFGGPLDIHSLTALGDTSAIRRVLTLDCSLIASSRQKPIAGLLPLFFPLLLEAGEIAYVVPTIDLPGQTTLEVSDFGSHSPVIDHVRVRGSNTKAWPYAGFPQLLPYIQLETVHVKATRANAIRNEFRERGCLSNRNCLVVVPPLAWLQISLFGRYGDDAGVSMIFDIDPISLSVSAETSLP